MKTLRRFHASNVDYFITAVTYKRSPILLNDISLFFESWYDVDLKAWVLHQDHFHVILDVGGRDISSLMHRFKVTYSRRYREKHNPGRIWQNRFWDHIIRDENDFRRHLDYIHFNPVHHDLCGGPFEYPYSSLSRWFERGVYQRDWGKIEIPNCDGEFGE